MDTSTLDSINESLEARGLALVPGERGLTLVSEDGLALRVDLSRDLRRLRPQNLSRELLVRAARVRGVRQPRVLDATAGMGEDSLLLAAAGFEVTLYEHDRAVAALLRDAIARAGEDPADALSRAVARMRLVEGDSVAAMRRLATGLSDGTVPEGGRPDVVLLDPMFPERRKSASVKKKAQLLQRLEAPCEDEGAMLGAAVALRPRKVVIKRPAKGPWLAGERPSYSVSGKAVRYDVVVPR